MTEIYKCDCGKEYKRKGSLINHCIKEKHNNFSKEEKKLFKGYPIDVKKAILREDITFRQAEEFIMKFTMDNPEISEKYQNKETLLEFRKIAIKLCKDTKYRIKEIIEYYKRKGY